MSIFSLFLRVEKAYSTRCPHGFFPTMKFLCASFLNFRAATITQLYSPLRLAPLRSITKSRPILSPALVIFGDLRAAPPGSHCFREVLTLLAKF